MKTKREILISFPGNSLRRNNKVKARKVCQIEHKGQADANSTNHLPSYKMENGVRRKLYRFNKSVKNVHIYIQGCDNTCK